MSTPTTDDMLKAKLADYLGHLETAANKGGDFLAQQVPDVVRELIAWSIASSVMEIVLGVGITLAAILGARFGIGRLKRDYDFAANCAGICAIAGVIMFAGLLAFGDGLHDLVKCIVAPKLFVLDYVLTMVKPK